MAMLFKGRFMVFDVEELRQLPLAIDVELKLFYRSLIDDHKDSDTMNKLKSGVLFGEILDA